MPAAGADEEFGQLGDGGGADVLGEVRSARPQHPVDLGPRHGVGVRLVTRSNTSSANGSVLSSGTATTTTPRGCRSLVASAAFGGHASTAAMVGGNSVAPPAPRRRRSDVQCRRDVRQPLAHQSLITPGRPLFGGAAVQPGEVPPIDRRRIGFGYQVVECSAHFRHSRLLDDSDVDWARGRSSYR